MTAASRPELEKTFDPSSFEAKWYRLEEESGLFRPESAPPGAEPYALVIPPPNVTGRLHVGHALGRTIEDVLSRWRRMQGRAVLWVPGTDHAGIATQMVVEKDLKATEGKSRHDLGREAFVARCRAWADARRNDILDQIRRLGCSCDFSREYYTLDAPRSRAVRDVFCRLYHEGLAYRDSRMVNWCPSCATVLSDLEVNHVEKSGHLWSVAYPLEDGSGELVVATTRPETMLGDTALAVHPDDERYRAVVGKSVRVPLTDRVIPVVADAFVDRKFGTGVVKVTPAHDPNDFEAGRRNALASIRVIGFDGKMTSEAPAPYAGLDRFDARKKVLKDLDAAGLRRGEKSHVHAVGQCQRCDTVLEPLVSRQWFVKIKPLADKALEAADRGEVRFTPESWKKTYDEWMRNIRDWCVSRQLWWGHEIPAWYCPDGHVTVPKPGEPDPAACAVCAKAPTRDPDVFDTWFSSWLMPLSVFGWPERTKDFDRFYPTSVLVTGFDILFFWVARMVMAGLWFDGRSPFRDVCLHGLVRDEKGRKMSKTVGNVIDPLEMCDEYGADAVRFALAVQSGTGRDIPFGTSRLAPARAFATKVWNAARFAIGMMAEGGDDGAPRPLDFAALSIVDRWILSRLAAATAKVNESLEAFRFDEAANALYQFFWSEFCDGYVELVKPVLRGDAPESRKAETRAVLRRVLLDSVAILHPFMPFVTCEIREALSGDGAKLPTTPFPKAEASWDDPLAVETVETLRAAATRIRNLRAERGLAQTEPLAAGLETDGPLAAALRAHAPLLVHLARLSSLEVAEAVPMPGAFRDAIGGVGLVVKLPAKELTEAERAKLEKELAGVEKEAAGLERKLADASFLERAPAAVVDKSRKQLAELMERRARLAANLEREPVG